MVAAEVEDFFLGTELVVTVSVVTISGLLGGPSKKSLSQTFESRESQIAKEERTAIWLKDFKVVHYS